MKRDIISATYATREEAETIIHRLEKIGIVEQQIGLIAKEEVRTGMLPPHAETDVTVETAAAGAAAGGLTGTILGALATASLITLPGLNIIAIGTLYTTLAGLATGAITGGVVGALVGAGISPDDAKIYERELSEKNAVLLTVRPMDNKQHDKIKNIMGETEAKHLAA